MPRTSVGNSGAIFFHCSSLSQNKLLRIIPTLKAGTQRITIRFTAQDFYWVLTLVGPALSEKAPPQQQTEGAAHAKQVPNSPSPSAEVRKAHPENTETGRSAEQAGALEGLYDWLIRFLDFRLTNAVIAGFTMVLALKTAGLFRETAGLRAAANQQAMDTKTSLDIAKQAADAATLQATAAIGAELPMLQVRSATINTFAPEEAREWRNGFTIDLDIKNYGRTPAFVSEVVVNAIIEKGIAPVAAIHENNAL